VTAWAGLTVYLYMIINSKRDMLEMTKINHEKHSLNSSHTYFYLILLSFRETIIAADKIHLGCVLHNKGNILS
jgi:hypothetical protein